MFAFFCIKIIVTQQRNFKQQMPSFCPFLLIWVCWLLFESIELRKFTFFLQSVIRRRFYDRVKTNMQPNMCESSYAWHNFRVCYLPLLSFQSFAIKLWWLFRSEHLLHSFSPYFAFLCLLILVGHVSAYFRIHYTTQLITLFNALREFY